MNAKISQMPCSENSLAAVVVLLATLLIAQPTTSAADDDFNVQEVVAAIKREIQLAQGTDVGPPAMRIDRVEVRLKVLAKQEAGARVDIKVASIGAEAELVRSQEKMSTIALTLIPTGDTNVAKGETLGLVPAINKVKESWKVIYNTPPPFRMDSFVFEVETVVERTAGGALRFIVVGPEMKNKTGVTHTIKFFMVVQKR